MSEHTGIDHEPSWSDDFHPTDLINDVPVSSDFVESTLERVLADRREILAEAERVDEIEFPRALLDDYEAPAVSADFVDRPADLVASGAWRDTLDSFTPPQPTADFVDRTLSALRIDRSSLRIVTPNADADTASDQADAAPVSIAPAPAAPLLRFRRAIAAAAAAAAAIAVIALAFTLSKRDDGTGDDDVVSATFVAEAYTPAAWSTELADVWLENDDDLDFQPVASLDFHPERR